MGGTICGTGVHKKKTYHRIIGKNGLFQNDTLVMYEVKKRQVTETSGNQVVDLGDILTLGVGFLKASQKKTRLFVSLFFFSGFGTYAL